jgi:hypothetical protein
MKRFMCRKDAYLEGFQRCLKREERRGLRRASRLDIAEGLSDTVEDRRTAVRGLDGRFVARIFKA